MHTRSSISHSAALPCLRFRGVTPFFLCCFCLPCITQVDKPYRSCQPHQISHSAQTSKVHCTISLSWRVYESKTNDAFDCQPVGGLKRGGAVCQRRQRSGQRLDFRPKLGPLVGCQRSGLNFVFPYFLWLFYLRRQVWKQLIKWYFTYST